VRISGIIEGFYGPPWSHADRLDWIDRLGDWGMTHYVWAAKAEPRHRDHWRDPFTDTELEGFSELAARHPSITLAVGLTPGADATTDEVVGKLAPAVGAGAGVVVLSCDDLPALDAGAAHRDLAHALRDRLGCGVWIVPTHYCGVDDSPYLHSLTDGLAPDIEVMWTGRRVVNDTITADDAHRWAEHLGRPPLVWDNTPVNDSIMAESLHLGPYAGRDPQLLDACCGILWNPMEFATASIATLTSAAAWCRGDDPIDAWRDEVQRRGWYHLALATAFRTDPVWPGDDVDATWFGDVLAGLPDRASDVGLDDATQRWIDAAREGAAIAVEAAAIGERLVTRGASTGVTMRQAGLALRWRAWRRREALTFGGGPRIRPVLGQDHRGDFVSELAAFEFSESLVDLAIRRALPS
jgi:hypothetical protein